MASRKSYTWQEVAKHNTAASTWVSVNNKVYDITGWLDKHPGGREYLELAAGRDITYLFASYHPFSEKPTEILKKYEIGTLSSHEFPTYKPDTGFYKECREAVGKYFTDNKLHYKNPVPGLIRLACVLSIMAFSFYSTYFAGNSFWVRFFFASLFGVCEAITLIHQMHDACHSSIGPNEFWWKSIGKFTMDFLTGGDMKHWHHQHVLGHHIYTNVMGVDPDLPEMVNGDMRYIVPRQVYNSIYKVQWIYMPILYAGLTLKIRLQNWTTTWSTLMNGPIRVNPISKAEYYYFFFSRAVNLGYQLAIPLFFGVHSVVSVFGFWVLQELAFGLWLATNFQVSHISTEAAFPCDKKFDPAIKDEWAVLQVLSSVDYAHENSVATFLSGALNYQTTHHLFPSVSQYHYPAITPIIMEVCKKWKVPFNHLPTFYDAFSAHLVFLYKMGNQVEV